MAYQRNSISLTKCFTPLCKGSLRTWESSILHNKWISIVVTKANSFFLLALQPPLGVVFYSPLGGFSLLACEVSWSHTTTHHIRQDSSERMTSPSQRPLPDNTQHSQQTNIHAPGGIRTHNLSRRAAKDLRLRPRGHWDRQLWILLLLNL